MCAIAWTRYKYITILLSVSADPNFYNKNLLMLGITLQKMGKKEEANEYFTRAFHYPIKSKEDQKVKCAVENYYLHTLFKIELILNRSRITQVY